ncbi:MAG: MFS transporter [Acetobacterales bacterium]
MSGFLPPLAAFWLARTSASAAFLTLQIAAPAAAADLGVEVGLVGIVSSLAFFGTMLGSPTAAPLVARLGPIRLMQLSLIGCAGGLLLAACGWLWLMVPAAFFIGLAQGPITPAGSRLLVRHTPQQILSLIFGISQTGVTLGTAMAGALVPAVTVAFGWQAGVASVSALCLLAALLAQPLHASLDRERDSSAPFSLVRLLWTVRLVLRDPPLRDLTLTACAYGAMQWCMGTFLVAYLGSGLGLTLVAAGWALSLSQLAGTIGRVLWGLVADLVGSPRLVLGGLGLLMSAAGVAMAFLHAGWPLWTIMTLSFVLGLAATGYNGIYLAELARLSPPGEEVAATGGSIFVFCAVSIVAPAVFSGIVATTGDYGNGFLALSVVTLFAALRHMMGGRRQRSGSGPEAP